MILFFLSFWPSRTWEEFRPGSILPSSICIPTSTYISFYIITSYSSSVTDADPAAHLHRIALILLVCTGHGCVVLLHTSREGCPARTANQKSSRLLDAGKNRLTDEDASALPLTLTDALSTFFFSFLFLLNLQLHTMTAGHMDRHFQIDLPVRFPLSPG